MDAIRQLVAIMARLRDPDGGCPWDQQQTYASIVPYTLEEVGQAFGVTRERIRQMDIELFQ